MVKTKINNFYNKYHKQLLIVPVLLFMFSFIYLGLFYLNHENNFVEKDVSLTGGTTITVLTSTTSLNDLQTFLSKDFPGVSVMSLSDNSGKQTHLTITVKEEPKQIIPVLEEYFGYKLTTGNSSTEFTGSGLSNNFYSQLIRAMIFAFLLMAWVVFYIFGDSKKLKVYTLLLTLITAKLTFPNIGTITFVVVLVGIVTYGYSLYSFRSNQDYLILLGLFLLGVLSFIFPIYYLIIPISAIIFSISLFFSVPSISVIISAFGDILMPLVVIDILGIKLSSAGIIAFLMLIGYSVGTDILLTTRVLKRQHESVNKAIYGAFKTGMTMMLTSIVAILIAFITTYRFGTILNEIFLILLLGLIFDIFNTWVTNASMIKWYAERLDNQKMYGGIRQ